MRTSDDLPHRNGHPHPNPLASHAPVRVGVNGMAPDASTTQQPNGATSSRPGTSATNRSVSRVAMDEQAVVARGSRNDSPGRPGMLRAKSDFGPRHPPAPSSESANEGSVDGHFTIRHGWADQLNSEEYSNLLTSVCNASGPWNCASG
jgi:regulator-associated protein of mTOR